MESPTKFASKIYQLSNGAIPKIINNIILIYCFTISINFFSYSKEIIIESDELFIADDPLINIFIGKVYAYDDEIKLWSDKVKIYYFGENNKIERIVSTGNSKMIWSKVLTTRVSVQREERHSKQHWTS